MTLPDALRKSSDRQPGTKGKSGAGQSTDHRHASRSIEESTDEIWAASLKFGSKPANVLLILAAMTIIAGMFVRQSSTAFQTQGRRSPHLTADKELRVLRTALERFRSDCGRYPETHEGIEALIINPGSQSWRGPYVTLTKPDPWHHHYCYGLINNRVTLFSAGPDGQPSTADDLNSEDMVETTNEPKSPSALTDDGPI